MVTWLSVMEAVPQTNPTGGLTNLSVVSGQRSPVLTRSQFEHMPDEPTILRFRHGLEEHKLAEQILAPVNELLSQRGLPLKTGTVVDATLIAAPTSTKNKDMARGPDMHSSKKSNQ